MYVLHACFYMLVNMHVNMHVLHACLHACLTIYYECNEIFFSKCTELQEHD
jgi:hypothetical protein